MNPSFFRKNFTTVLKAGAEILLAGFILINTSFLQLAIWQYYRIVQDANSTQISAPPAFEEECSENVFQDSNKKENTENQAQTREDLLSILREAVVSSSLLFFPTLPDPNKSLNFIQYTYISHSYFPNCITQFSIPILRAPPLV